MKCCEQCGNQLFDEAVFCPKCNQPVISNYKITIRRDYQFFIGKMVFKLVVDDKDSYTIDNNEVLEIELPAGQHRLYFQYSFRSKTVDVNLNRDIELSLSWERILGGFSIYEV